MDSYDFNNILNLPKLDDISLDFCYCQMPLSLFCKVFGITEEELMEDL